VRSLSWSVSSHFVAIRSWNVRRNLKFEFKVVDFDVNRKAVFDVLLVINSNRGHISLRLW